jgi:hypothetical protein
MRAEADDILASTAREFEMALDLKTEKALGLAVPPSIMLCR